MLGALLTIFGAVVFFMWAIFAHSTPAERQAVVDASCPSHEQYIRYPDGYRKAVCNPTHVAWKGELIRDEDR